MVYVYHRSELPPENIYALERMGYDLSYYAYVAIGVYGRGWGDLEKLFGYAHIISPKGDYADEPAVFHYALIEPK